MCTPLYVAKQKNKPERHNYDHQVCFISTCLHCMLLLRLILSAFLAISSLHNVVQALVAHVPFKNQETATVQAG